MPGGPENLAELSSAHVLVVGAGGLGCEILKDLALSGFKKITVIDLDKIDLTNLNRQFLFRETDIGKYKADVAAAFVMRRVKGVKITAYTKPIQEFPVTWYKQFDFVIAGLDNIAARQWLNNTLCDLVEISSEGEINWKTVIPLIDGGTEGFKGQSRVLIPHLTSCFECSMDSMTPATGYAVCTIKTIPRQPEHCVMYAMQMRWNKLIEFNSPTDFKIDESRGEKDPAIIDLDTDNIDHMLWLEAVAVERAAQFEIKGVTLSLTQQVVKNIIPAIASINALISASCVSEVFKLKTFCAERMDNFWAFASGVDSGLYSNVTQYQRKADCPACRRYTATLPGTTLVSELLEKLKTDLNYLEVEDDKTGVKTPAKIQLSCGAEILYGKNLSWSHHNLTKPISEVFKSFDLLRVDGDGPTRRVQIRFS